MFKEEKNNEKKFELKMVLDTDMKETEVNKYQRWKVKVYTDDSDRLEHHVNKEKDSKVFQYNSKHNDKNRGAIKNVNSVEKYQNEP